MNITQKQNKVSFNLDESCDNCKQQIAKIEQYFKEIKKENVYMNVYMKGDKKMKMLGCIKIIPDFNSAGYLTHWHIEFVEEEK